jgi:hypothetical protein
MKRDNADYEIGGYRRRLPRITRREAKRAAVMTADDMVKSARI